MPSHSAHCWKPFKLVEPYASGEQKVRESTEQNRASAQGPGLHQARHGEPVASVQLWPWDCDVQGISGKAETSDTPAVMSTQCPDLEFQTQWEGAGSWAEWPLQGERGEPVAPRSTKKQGHGQKAYQGPLSITVGGTQPAGTH